MVQTETAPTATLAVTHSGAEQAIAALEAHGVETVFGIPGVHTLALYDALLDSPIRHVLARHEQGAGFMADGYARATGRPGVAVIITGPGITNVATPIGEAYADSSPVFVLSSNVERAYVDRMRGSLHDLKDQLGVMAAVTQWNTRANAAAAVYGAVAEGFRRLGTGRPRPVHVEIPLDVLDERAEDDDLAVSLPAALRPNPRLLRDAADRLKRAKRPLLYCGGGAVTANAGPHVLAIAERLGAPVLTSTMGKGSVSEDHPLVVGALWGAGNAVDALLRETECLVVFGSKLGAQDTHDFTMPLCRELIRVDVDPDELILNAQPSLGIVGDAALAAEGIATLLAGEDFRGDGFGASQVQAAKHDARANAFGADRLPYLDALRRAVPRDGIVAWDMTMMSYAAIGLFPAYEPRTFQFPAGYGTLGYALPAAIGAKIGRPDTAVVAVCGDGGFQFTMQEVATAVSERLGLPIVIFNDSTYSAVKDAQRSSRDGRYLAVDLINPDYVALARAYAIPGVRAESPAALEAAVVEALERDLPTIIDVPIAGWV
ncbi:MAG: Acetolactate synthase large subunit [uncultured Thermomicrobiales bacterium]|uniref:Acetolactate synthase large subunit n=1 Tax=uncultured Thermomicrobiales bacterium TaxID=1645740 RepID=A0A6J4UTQ8_9BACT|nr:MAG: Acetolactate synthase large subunit [uncultured Thermomicrobiales bacterium]